MAPPPGRVSRALHLYCVATAFATLCLIVAGALVTSTESGLAVPDWPLSYGQLFPPMVGGIFWEHGHRMVAGTVALMTLGLAIWMSRAEPRPWVRKLAYAALATVVTQALLGGITVLYFLPTPVSVAHALVAQSFFCILVILALSGSPRWEADREPLDDPRGHGLRLMALGAAAAVFGQLLLGALMRHSDAGLAIASFPLANGRLIPADLASPKVAIHFAHRAGALVVAAAVLAAAARVLSVASARPRLARPALLAVLLVALQIGLGAATVLTRKAVVPATAHVATGALLLAVSVVLAVRSLRMQLPERAPGLLEPRQASS